MQDIFISLNARYMVILTQQAELLLHTLHSTANCQPMPTDKNLCSIKKAHFCIHSNHALLVTLCILANKICSILPIEASITLSLPNMFAQHFFSSRHSYNQLKSLLPREQCNIQTQMLCSKT